MRTHLELTKCSRIIMIRITYICLWCVEQRRLEGNLWKARLAGTADKFFSVDCIRKVNTNPPFDGNTLKKFEIGIPEKLNNVAKKHGIHEEFRKHISADICRYILEKNVLRIISREAEITSKQITILKNMHIKHLERKSHESEPNLWVLWNFVYRFFFLNCSYINIFKAVGTDTFFKNYYIINQRQARFYASQFFCLFFLYLYLCLFCFAAF